MFVLNIMLPMYGLLLAQPIMDVISLSVAVTLYVHYKRRRPQFC